MVKNNSYKKKIKTYCPSNDSCGNNFYNPLSNKLISFKTYSIDISKEIPNTIPNLREKVITIIKKIICSIECTTNQKETLMSKSLEILNEFISNPIGSKNLKLIASTIVYTAIVSNDNMPKISGEIISEIIDVQGSDITRLYNNRFKDNLQRFKFDFQHKHWGKCIENMSLFLFDLLLYNEIDTPELVMRLKEIVSDKIEFNELTTKEKQLRKQLDDQIHTFYDMAVNYQDIFAKYFSDFVDFIKLLIISNRSHKIIGADFSVVAFIRYLKKERNIDFFLAESSLKRFVGKVFNALKNSKYAYLFPSQMQSMESGVSHRARDTIIGSRIKLYVMKHINNGKYFIDGVSVCPDCIDEGFIINTVFPRIRSKEFHHYQTKVNNYTSNKLFHLFVEDRGNPYFLSDLIKKMESESIVLRCSVHHHLIHSEYFSDFRKLINWEKIPQEFPQDIFSIPAEFIHILSMICIDNFHKTKLKNTNQKAKIRISELIYNIKKRYIIDIIYDGICPACKEISIKDHLSSFDFNHLFELIKTSFKNGEKVERKKIKDLAHLPCSGIVKKLVEEQGGFVCRNCHRVIHNNIQFVNLIYDKENTRNLVIEDYNKTIVNFEQNLISYDCSFEDPLETEFNINRSIIDYLFVFFDILKVKKVVTTQDLMDKMNRSRTTISSFFVKHKDLLSKYGKIKRSKTTEYYLNEEGKKFVRLMIYFRDYYNNLI